MLITGPGCLMTKSLRMKQNVNTVCILTLMVAFQRGSIYDMSPLTEADPGICERDVGVSPSFPLPFPSLLPFSFPSPSRFRISAP